MANFHGFQQNARRVVVCHGVLSKLRGQALHVEVTARQCTDDPVGTISPAHVSDVTKQLQGLPQSHLKHLI